MIQPRLWPRIEFLSSGGQESWRLIVQQQPFKEALQIPVKRREVKGKEEKERYTNLNAEFLRISRRDKKASLNDQCKEIEKKNRMGKTRDLFN